MFKERLKELRKQKGIKTQEELARLSGLSIATIKSLESGRKQPGRKTLLRLAKLFNCDVDYLLNREKETEQDKIGKEEGKVVFGDMAELVKLLEEIPEEQRKAAIQLLRTLK